MFIPAIVMFRAEKHGKKVNENTGEVRYWGLVEVEDPCTHEIFRFFYPSSTAKDLGVKASSFSYGTILNLSLELSSFTYGDKTVDRLSCVGLAERGVQE